MNDDSIGRSRDSESSPPRTLSPVDLLYLPPPPSILVRPREVGGLQASGDSSFRTETPERRLSHYDDEAQSTSRSMAKMHGGLSPGAVTGRPLLSQHNAGGSGTLLESPLRLALSTDSTNLADEHHAETNVRPPNPRGELIRSGDRWNSAAADSGALAPNTEQIGLGIGVTFHPTVSMVSSVNRPRPYTLPSLKQTGFGAGLVSRTLSVDSTATGLSQRSYFSLKKEFERIAKNSPQPFYRKRHLMHLPLLLFDFGEEDQEHRASWEELFYDLLYVGGIIRVDILFGYEPTLHGLVVVLVFFLVLWWSWNLVNGYYSRFSANDRIHGLLNWLHMV
ncbi:hypothetical protein HDU93_005763, partial [Gonapodya sp. JEL0774]